MSLIIIISFWVVWKLATVGELIIIPFHSGPLHCWQIDLTCFDTMFIVRILSIKSFAVKIKKTIKSNSWIHFLLHFFQSISSNSSEHKIKLFSAKKREPVVPKCEARTNNPYLSITICSLFQSCLWTLESSFLSAANLFKLFFLFYFLFKSVSTFFSDLFIFCSIQLRLATDCVILRRMNFHCFPASITKKLLTKLPSLLALPYSTHYLGYLTKSLL